jgi:hypothetical protein
MGHAARRWIGKRCIRRGRGWRVWKSLRETVLRKSVAAVVGAFAAGAVVALAGPASAAGTGTIQVPSGFDHSLSDTRATGHYEVQGDALHVWTEGNTSTDKVAEYVDTTVPLSGIGEPTLDLTNNSGSIPPGFQLVVDFDNDGSADGILVGEPTYYGSDWWLNNAAAQFVKDGAPSHAGGSGSDNHGTLDQWRAAFPDAQVTAFGFSLGSGVQGDWLINAINFNGTRHTFVQDVQLTNKNECKNGGWATSTMPVYKNQGQCVSHFASGK